MFGIIIPSKNKTFLRSKVYISDSVAEYLLSTSPRASGYFLLQLLIL